MKNPVMKIILIASLLASASSLFSQAPNTQPTPRPASTPAGVQAKDAETFFKRGQGSWKEFDVAATIENYTKALQFMPDHADALKARGTVYYMIGRYEDAVTDLSSFLKTYRADADVLFYRGMAYSSLARAQVDAGVSEKEWNVTADKAYSDFNAAIKLDPSNALYYNGRGRLYVDVRFFAEAIADLETAIRLDSKFAAAYSNLGLAKLMSASGGLAEFNRAIELNPGFGEAYFNRANYQRIRGNLDAAEADYTKAIAEHGTNAQYYNGRGMVYLAQGKGFLAAKDFTSAISQKQDFAIAYLNRALTYKSFPGAAADNANPDVGEAIVAQRLKMRADLDAAIKYNPSLADAYTERGLMNWTTTGSTLDAKTLAQINTALADFDRAISLDPQSGRAFAARGAIYQKLGKPTTALADYNRAIEIDPRLVTAYMGRMSVHCAMGNKELSFADEKKVVELGHATINMCSLSK